MRNRWAHRPLCCEDAATKRHLGDAAPRGDSRRCSSAGGHKTQQNPSGGQRPPLSADKVFPSARKRPGDSLQWRLRLQSVHRAPPICIQATTAVDARHSTRLSQRRQRFLRTPRCSNTCSNHTEDSSDVVRRYQRRRGEVVALPAHRAAFDCSAGRRGTARREPETQSG